MQSIHEMLGFSLLFLSSKYLPPVMDPNERFEGGVSSQRFLGPTGRNKRQVSREFVIE